MSLTLITQPPYHIQMAGNDNYSTLSGTTLGAPNVFDYKFIADIYVAGILQATLKSFPDPQFGFGVFNTRSILSSFMSYDFFGTTLITSGNPGTPAIPVQLSRNAPNSGIDVLIKYGEEYTSGSTFIQNRALVNGNATSYINGSLSYTDSIQTNLDLYDIYNPNNFSLLLTARKKINPIGDVAGPFVTVYPGWRYIFSGVCQPGSRAIGNAPGWIKYQMNAYTDDNWQNPIWALAFGNAGLAGFPSGGSLAPVQIVEFGIDAINAMHGAQIAVATQPLIPANAKSYRISYANGSTQVTEYVYARIGQDCGRFAAGAYMLYWLNEFGGWDQWLFNKKNETTQSNNSQAYKKITGQLQTGGNYLQRTRDRSNQKYFTETTDSITMNSDFLSDDDVIFLKTLVSSPVVFMEDTNQLITAVTIDTDSYRINKRVNQKIYNLTLTVKQSVDNYRQNL